jgi:ABC-type lipoprotein release transport system permease subunit
MAWRNLWRHRRRTLLTLSSIVFGVFLAVMVTAMQDRNFAEMIDLAARLGGGHVSLQHPEYLDTPTLSRRVGRTDELSEIALGDPRVLRVVQRISGQTMLSTAGESQGAAFVGFDPAEEDEETFALMEALASGEMFGSSRDKGIILGARLAQNLDADLGDKVVYTMTDASGQIVSGLGRVTGLVRTGAPSLDGALCLLPIDALREVLGYAPDEATQVALFLDDQRRSDLVIRRLGKRLGPDVAAVPWHQAQPEMAAFIAMKVGGARVIEILIAVLVAAGIFNTLFVSVMERLREFGILLAIGFSPGRLFRLVMFESFWLGLVGLAVAALVTLGPYLHLSATGIDLTGSFGEGEMEIAGVAMPMVLRVGIFPESLAIIVLSALLAVMLSGLYPAWKAGRVEPVETIRLV